MFKDSKLKHITVSPEIYLTLKRLGGAGDSFNHVIKELLNEKGVLKSESPVPTKRSDSSSGSIDHR
jgi:predicted CopG family antitoxin